MVPLDYVSYDMLCILQYTVLYDILARHANGFHVYSNKAFGFKGGCKFRSIFFYSQNIYSIAKNFPTNRQKR